MTARNRRRFLLATATAATIGSTGAAGATREGTDDATLAERRRGDVDERERPLRANDSPTREEGASRAEDDERTGQANAGDERDGCEREDADRDRSNETAGDADSGDAPAVEFLDCRRVRIVGDCADVIVSIAFDVGDGAVGTIVEPVGGVDGERTIDAAAEFDLAPETTVLAAVELFETADVATPGLGDRRAENHDEATCLEARLGHLDGVGG